MEKKRILILSAMNSSIGLEKFKRLTDLGWEIISTKKGFSEKLDKLDIPCLLVEEASCLPMDKKYHHLGPVVAHGIGAIHMVVANLYGFNVPPTNGEIDIISHSLLRAAAKNNEYTIPILDLESDLEQVVSDIENKGEVHPLLSQRLAIKVFKLTSSYDQSVYNWMYEEMNKMTE